MKKIRLILVSFFMSAMCCVQAQVKNTEITLAEMEMPTSPAFMLLDQAPTNIERPTHAKAFALDVLNNFIQQGGLPQNYALEFTPYWFLPPAKGANPLTFAGLKKKNGDYINAPFASAKEATISLAYLNGLDSITNQNLNNLVIGVRTTLLRFYTDERKEKIIEEYNNATFMLLNLIDLELSMGATAKLRRENRAQFDSIKIEAGRIFEERRATAASADMEFDDYKMSLKEALEIKPQFAVDAALAYSRIFMGDNFNQNQFGRFGVWATANYSNQWDKDKNNYLNIYGTMRYLRFGYTDFFGGNRYANNFDYGLKLELEFDRASIAYENIKRVGDFGKSKRSVGIIKYKLNEKLYLTGAFGQNFESQDNLVALMGINWGFKSGNENLNLGAN